MLGSLGSLGRLGKSAPGGAPPAVPAALPAVSTATGKNFASMRETVGSSSIGLPSGDWAVGGWFNLPKAAANNTGFVWSFYNSGGTATLSCRYERATGLFYLGGLDDVAGALGAHGYPTTGTAPQFLIANQVAPAGTDVYVVCQKKGTKAQIWLKFNGHAPILAAEEETVFGAIASRTFQFARGRSDVTPLDAKMRNWFKLSYSLSQAQIEQAANDVDPSTFGTPAADDFYFPLNDASTTVYHSNLNNLNTTWGGGTGASVTGIGYAPMTTDAVQLDPVGCDGFVFQHVGGFATVPLSGTYLGADGGNIEVQVLSDAGAVVKAWTTVASGISGGLWSGSLSLPKGKRWLRVQMRKSANRAVVNTSTLRWGIGENVMLDGQSLMYYQGVGGGAYGWNAASVNAYSSFMSSIPVVQSATSVETLTVTGAASNGGLIEITTTGPHGRRDGDTVGVNGVVGTTEANGQLWTIAVTAKNKFTLTGSTFVHAYVSGGSVYIGRHYWIAPDLSYQTLAGGHGYIADAIAANCDTVVAIINKAISGTSIGSHNVFGQTSSGKALAAKSMRRLGWYVWQQGNNDLGLSPISTYFADGGVSGAWTGYGQLGVLQTLLKGLFPNNDFQMGVVPFTSVTGNSGYVAATHDTFRWGMKDWCDRKKAAGDMVFPMSFLHELQPQLESNGIGAHLCPEFKGQKSAAARIGQDLAKQMGGAANDAFGPRITGVTRSGAVLTLTVAHNGGTSLRKFAAGALASGFEVSTNNTFTAPQTITDVAIVDATTLQITLASDPGAACYVRYMYGKVGNYGNVAHSILVTGLADNGAGLVRVACTSSTTPASFQKNGGHGIVNGQAVRISGVQGTNSYVNGVWTAQNVDTTHFDLVGSNSASLVAFVATNIWGSGGNPVAELELANPIYDDRTIGAVDANGAPLQPVFGYLMAA